MSVDTVISRHCARLREATITRLAGHLAAHPPAPGTERVVLFGSLARGDFDGASDADLLVIGGGGVLDLGIHEAAGRGRDVIPWTAEQGRGALERGHPMAQDIARDSVELWPSASGAT